MSVPCRFNRSTHGPLDYAANPALTRLHPLATTTVAAELKPGWACPNTHIETLSPTTGAKL